MFGKGARQIQADPTLDISKCKCCNCDKVECRGCIEGHFINEDVISSGYWSETPQDNLDKGLIKSGGCCHGPNNGLIFEYERPGDLNYGPECCPDVNQPCCPAGEQCPPDLEGNDLPVCDNTIIRKGVRRCCGIREIGASNVRFYYNYIGKYFKMDYAAAGKNETVWPRNGRPRLCSLCNPASLDSDRPSTWNGARETCLDFKPPNAIDDKNTDPNSYPCSKEFSVPWTGCQCMGEERLKDTNPTSKRLSYYRRREMERLPYYRWLADVMCYDKGNVVANPYYQYTSDGETVPQLTNGTLYEHLLAVVHCEHWYELALCDQNPEHEDGARLGEGMTDSDGNPININTSILAPRFWVYACSGVPFFDFELEEAVKKGYISDAEYQEVKEAFNEGKTPRQEIMNSIAKGGYFDTADWRQEALSEIRDLRTRKYTADSYGGIINGDTNIGSCCLGVTCIDGVSAEYCSLTGGNFFAATRCDPVATPYNLTTTCNYKYCSDLDYLGPVRKRYWQDDINVPGVSGPGRLDPKKARPNTILPPRGTVIEPVINSLEDPTLRRIQLPEYLLRDPWQEKNKPYPKDPGPGASGEIYREWEDFQAWRDSQWVYMHARPGGWDYVCSGYQDPQNPDPELRIPDLPRRYSNLPNTLGAGCLDGILGIPVSEREVSGGCSDIKCGAVDPLTGQFVQYPLVGCNYAASCLSIDCDPSAIPECPNHPEKGGGPSLCRNVAMTANCNGIRFNYTTYKPVTRTIPIDPCESQDPSECFQTVNFHTCDKIRNAYVYRVNLTKGNYDSFCPFVCRNVEIPKPLERAIPVLSSNKQTWVKACTDALSENNYPVRFCPGYYCFGQQSLNPSQGTYGGSIPGGFPFYPNCCGRNGTGRVTQPLPRDPTHDASNKQDCPLYPGPGYPQIYDGQFIGINLNLNPFGCCWKCPISAGGTAECLGVIQEGECLTHPANDGVEYKTVFKTEITMGCCDFDARCGCSTDYLADCVTPPSGGGTPPGGGGGPD